MVSAELTGATPGRSAPNQPPRSARQDVPAETLFEQGFGGDSLYALRSAVAAHAAAVADEYTVDTMVLIAHELASNAVRHGGGTGRLRLWLADNALHCEVTDSGTGLPNPGLAGRALPAPSLPGGRGLWIARQLSELHVASSPQGTTICATVSL
jgi:anti-sigma regulatory factor (Ser/Thr protein kinase)